MKKYKNYIILGVIIAILIAGYIIISGIDTTNKEPENDNVASMEAVYSVNSEEIISANIKNEYGEYTVLFGETVTVEGKDIEKDDDKLRYLLTEVSSVYASSKVGDNITELNVYGLDNPYAVLTLTDKNNNKTVLALGNKTPVGSEYYANYNNGTTVYIISEYSVSAVLRKLDYYRNTVLFSIETDNVNSISFTKQGASAVTFEKTSVEDTSVAHNVFAAYRMTSPYSWDAEGTQVGNILTAIQNLSIVNYVEDYPEDLSKYGLNPYYARVVITEKNGKVNELLIGSNVDGNYYIKVSGKYAVYTVSASAFGFLDYEPTAFLQQFAFLKNIDTVKTIEYSHNDIKATFDIKKIEQEVHDVKYNGKNISQSTFKELYTELISMSVSGPLSYTPSGTPMLTYKFIYNDGTSETVNYYKYDERKIALSVNGKVQFYVDSSEFNMRINKIDSLINKF